MHGQYASEWDAQTLGPVRVWHVLLLGSDLIRATLLALHPPFLLCLGFRGRVSYCTTVPVSTVYGGQRPLKCY